MKKCFKSLKLLIPIYFLLLIFSFDLYAKVETPVDFKIAFIGDQGLGPASRAVLRLIKNEGADLVLHQGDFDYADKPSVWEAQINKILGANFPYIASAGNHDMKAWFQRDGYRALLEKRSQRTPGLKCTGEHGVNGVCIYKGVMVVTSGVGTIGKKTYEYLQGVLNQSGPYVWKFCSWHKQQRSYQLGDKGNAVAWKYYSLCKKHGAIIAQGHEHSYSRTYTMSNFEKHTIFDKSDTVTVGPNLSFTFTNGLGGANIRKQFLCKRAGECPYWAKIYTYDQRAKDGALFCTINKAGIEKNASCYFKNTAGQVIDQFKIVNLNNKRSSLKAKNTFPRLESISFPTEISTKADLW